MNDLCLFQPIIETIYGASVVAGPAIGGFLFEVDLRRCDTSFIHHVIQPPHELMEQQQRDLKFQNFVASQIMRFDRDH